MKIKLTPPIAAISAALSALVSFTAVANPTVTITSVTQNIPWNGKVNIAYTIGGERSAGAWQLVFSGTIGEGAPFTLSTFESTPSMDVGDHVAVWNAGADGAVFGTNPFVASVKLNRTDIVYDGEYMVIDVSGGRDAASYPVTFTEADSTADFNVDEYKLGKIVLKKVKAGIFLMGSPEGEEGRNKTLYNYPTGGEETQHYVKFSRDFYFSVFPVTCTQFSNVVAYGNAPWGTGDILMKPVNCQTYTQLRANGGFFSVLNAKTAFLGMPLSGYNLPTESQWEYVCRAGTTTPYWFGETGDDYVKYCGKWGSYATVAGTFPANPWGFYDMMGGNLMMCRDLQGAYPAGTADNPAIDPVHGDGVSGYAIRRGYASCTVDAGTQEVYFYRSACRESIAQGNKNSATGFQISITRSDMDNYEAAATAEGVTFDTDTSKEAIADATVAFAADELIYDGTVKTPVMTVTLGGKTLVEDTDYTVAYSDPVNAGTCRVTLTGKGHYSGTKTAEFYISYPQVGEEATAKAAMDFRNGVLEVLAPGTLFRVAHNNTVDWQKGGVASETVKARVAFAPLASAEATPDEGDFVTAVEADGEGTFKWIPPANGLYLARLQVVDGEAVVSTLTRVLKVTKSGIMIIVR